MKQTSGLDSYRGTAHPLRKSFVALQREDLWDPGSCDPVQIIKFFIQKAILPRTG